MNILKKKSITILAESSPGSFLLISSNISSIFPAVLLNSSITLNKIFESFKNSFGKIIQELIRPRTYPIVSLEKKKIFLKISPIIQTEIIPQMH